MGNVISGFQAWLAQPFDSGMSAYRWFAFVGLLIAITTAWHIVLRHLEEA